LTFEESFFLCSQVLKLTFHHVVASLVVGAAGFGLLFRATSLWAIVLGIVLSAVSGGAGLATLAALVGDLAPPGRRGQVLRARELSLRAKRGVRPSSVSKPDSSVASLPRNDMQERAPPRPTRVLPRPLPIRVIALVPDGPPTWFALRGREYVVARAWGPERIETAWWRGPDVCRDYFRVVAETGEQFWIFRSPDEGRWCLHGVFA